MLNRFLNWCSCSTIRCCCRWPASSNVVALVFIVALLFLPLRWSYINMTTNTNANANTNGDCIFLSSIRAYSKNIHGTSNVSHGTIQTCAVTHKLSTIQAKPSQAKLFAHPSTHPKEKYRYFCYAIQVSNITIHKPGKMTNKSTQEH